MLTDREDDSYFTYCGADWESLSQETREAIAAVARAAYDHMREDEDEDLA